MKNFCLFQFVCQKIKILNESKFNQEILINLSEACISLVSICSAALITGQLTIFVKLNNLQTGKELLSSFPGVVFDMVPHRSLLSYLVLGVLLTIHTFAE